MNPRVRETRDASHSKGKKPPPIRAPDKSHAAPAYSRAMRRIAAGLRRRLRARRIPLPPDPAGHELHAEVLATEPVLERILFQNLLPFWHPRVLDFDHGGYHLHHGEDGATLGPARKALVTNARTLWFFARMARAGHHRDTMLEAARHGYDFLVTSFLDDRHGGFYWHVSEDGAVPLDATKHQYGQAFAIYALAEYAMATGSTGPASLAEETCELVERYLRDPAGGGYWDQLERTWVPGTLDPSRTLGGHKYLGSMHHLMEAYTWQARASPRSLAASRLAELLLICSSGVVRMREGALTDAHRPDWSRSWTGRWAPSGTRSSTSPGWCTPGPSRRRRSAATLGATST